MNKYKKTVLALTVNLILVFVFVVFSAEVGAFDFENPLGLPEGAGPADFYSRVIKSALGVVGVLSLVVFIKGGIVWMTAGGNEEKVKSGRDTLLWATIGITAIFSAYAILSLIIGALSSTTYGT